MQSKSSPEAGGIRARAAVLDAIPGELHVRDVELPTSVGRPVDRMIVDIEACGVCGTDLHILAGQSYRPELPFVLGHEAVGVIVDTTAAAAHLRGVRVAVSPFVGCGECASCAAGDARLCRRGAQVTGVTGRWGAFATKMLVEADQIVPVPEGLDAVEAASLVDSGTTAVNALRAGPVTADDDVLVIGGGAIARVLVDLMPPSRSLTVVEPTASRRRAIGDARRPVRIVADLTGVTGEVSIAFECSGSGAVIAPALDRLVPHGRLILAGYATATVDFAVVARKELMIEGVRSGTPADLALVLDRAVAGVVRPSHPAVFSLERIDDALQALRSDAPPAKVVITP